MHSQGTDYTMNSDGSDLQEPWTKHIPEETAFAQGPQNRWKPQYPMCSMQIYSNWWVNLHTAEAWMGGCFSLQKYYIQIKSEL